MKRILVCIAVALMAVSCGPRPLVILHLNDTHSHMDPLRDGRAGVIERAAIIDSVRRAAGPKNVLLLHAGDFSQGTSYFTLMNGDLEVDMINALEYDCVTLGNHEFDNGIEELGRRVANLNCPVVCANYDFSPFEAGKYVKPWTIVKKAGLKIGIVGILCDVTTVVARETADRLPKFDTAETLNRWAAYLKNEEKCDLVIALTHIGFKDESGITDTQLAPLTRDVDIFVGGHSHTFLDEIYYATNLDGRQIPIVQDGCWGYEVGELTVRR
ncbi:MAG: metallophosphoesterase [Bacteroidales bacterium]|nr:metallophosphoesterase [Bacteroidales bacterium]